MSLVTATVNFDSLLEGVSLVQKQVPFAIARTLTRCAQQGQEAGREEEQAVFKLRNDWTTRNTKIKAATKDTLSAQVFTDTGNRTSGAPDYLEGQEDGRERVPINGRQHIAIPTRQLRQMVGDRPIPDWLRPKAMLQYAKLGGSYENRRGKVVKGNSQTRGYFFFLVTFKSGTKGIMARAVTDAKDAAVPMYIFVTHANIRKRLHLQDDVQKAIDGNLDANWTKTIVEIGLDDALRGTGVSIKL